MDPQVFKDLIASIKEAGAIRRKKVKLAELINLNGLRLKKHA